MNRTPNTNTVIKGATSNIAGWIFAIRDTLNSYQLDASDILQQAGITFDDLQQVSNRIEIEKINRLWQVIHRITEDDAFSLRVPRFMTQHALQGFSFAVSSSDNVHDLLSRITRFSKVASTAADVHLAVDKQRARLLIDTKRSAPTPADANIDAFAGVIVGTLRHLLMHSDTQTLAQPLHIDLRRPEPVNKTAFERFFRCPIQFNAGENAISYDTKVLTVINPYRDASVVVHNERAINDYLQQLSSDDICLEVQQILSQKIANGPVTQTALAKQLNMSSRSLQRSLQRQNTCFQTILDSVRYEFAKQKLVDCRHSVTEISHQLGYSDSSHFARSFKRWSGQSPTGFRSAQNAY